MSPTVPLLETAETFTELGKTMKPDVVRMVAGAAAP